MKKMDNIKLTITKDILYKDYIENNLSIRELCLLEPYVTYKIKEHHIYQLLKEYNITKSKDLRNQQIKKTCLEKYGVENYTQTAEYLEKSRKTCLEKYGVTSSNQAQSVKNKQKQRIKEKYGVDNISQLDETKAKVKNTCLAKYGTDSYSKTTEYKTRYKKTCLKNYGVENYGMTKEHKDHLRSEEYQNELQKNNLIKYGKKYFSQTDDFKTKYKITSLNHYGVDNPMKNKEVQTKKKEAYFIKHGVYSQGSIDRCYNKVLNIPSDIKDIFEAFLLKYNLQELEDYKIISIIMNKYFTNFIIEVCSEQKISMNDIANMLSCSYSRIQQLVKHHNLKDNINITVSYSSYELKIKDILLEINPNIQIISNDKSILDGKEIDIYLPEYNLGIEFNGSYWHSEANKDKNYHQEKSLAAISKGIFIYHIFEYEWLDPVKKEKIISQLTNLIKHNGLKIQARKCKIKEINSKTKSLFLDNNHLQGNDKSKINLGLYYDNELVSVMTFTKPRFTKKYEWELSRFCSKQGINVVGGASKLFAYFCNNFLQSGETILSYNDITKTKGLIYTSLGFTLSHISEPNYVWWYNDNEYKSRYQTMMKNEAEIMHDEGYIRIYDSGNNVWLYKKN